MFGKKSDEKYFVKEIICVKIIPVVSERTEVKELNFERAKKIVVDATEQSNQFTPPEILSVTKLKDFLQKLSKSTKLLFADINSNENLKPEDLKNFETLCILIGPEGDFSPTEREIITRNSSTKPFKISKNILRSDCCNKAISLVNFINNFH